MNPIIHNPTSLNSMNNEIEYRPNTGEIEKYVSFSRNVGIISENDA